MYNRYTRSLTPSTHPMDKAFFSKSGTPPQQVAARNALAMMPNPKCSVSI